jgi:hypothetical protein
MYPSVIGLHLPTNNCRVCWAGQQLVFTFDNWFSSSGQLSRMGRPLKLSAPNMLQPDTSKAMLHGVPGQMLVSGIAGHRH